MLTEKDLLVVLVLLATTAVVAVGLGSLTPYDSTDPPGGRSGLKVYVDHATGCEYLYREGLTPRLDGQGRHMGCRL